MGSQFPGQGLIAGEVKAEKKKKKYNPILTESSVAIVSWEFFLKTSTVTITSECRFFSSETLWF